MGRLLGGEKNEFHVICSNYIFAESAAKVDELFRSIELPDNAV